MLDVENARKLEIVQSEVVCGSVFIAGFGFCIEVDRAEFVAAISAEFDLLPVACCALVYAA